MQLGMIGLGRMGANMVRRLLRGGHQCVVFDLNENKVEELVKEGATGARGLAEFIGKLQPPRAAWVMVPAGSLTEGTVLALYNGLDEGDIIIDGGNSYFKDDVRRSKQVGERGIHY
ncbi:MAG TPA: NAD(P)-binding domain-containing protein, partial [Anaerolineae bacterium]